MKKISKRFSHLEGDQIELCYVIHKINYFWQFTQDSNILKVYDFHIKSKRIP